LIQTVRLARLAGTKAAERILRILEVRDRFKATSERVDVFDALAWLDVRVVFKPLETVLGLYIRGEQPGVMISTRRPLSVQRFTAAHELGHAVMQHEPSLDSEGVLRRAAYGQAAAKIRGFASYLQEIEADSFAGAFLLPNWLIAYHARKHGWSRANLTHEDVVYQLSLRCGASYQATVWALERNGIISEDARERLLKIQPKRIKQRIGHHAAAADSRNDAWVIENSDCDADIAINVGDTVTVSLRQEAGGGYLWLPQVHTPTVLAELETSVLLPTDQVGDASTRRTIYRADAAGLGKLHYEHKRPWEAVSEDYVKFQVVISDPERGLSRANRARLFSGARVQNAG
jgi:Zn-dependent peptidase ImmA (M78 family)/predicted secreted protein